MTGPLSLPGIQAGNMIVAGEYLRLSASSGNTEMKFNDSGKPGATFGFYDGLGTRVASIGPSGASSWGGGNGIGSSSDVMLRAGNLADVLDATSARANLGLRDMATQSSGSVAITGGALDGVSIGQSNQGPGKFTTLKTNGLTAAGITGGPTVGNLAYFDSQGTIADSHLTAAAINIGWSFDTCDPLSNGQPMACSGTTTLPVAMPDSNYQLTCNAEGWSDNSGNPAPYISFENHAAYGISLPTAAGSSLYYRVTWAMQNSADHFHAHAYCLVHHN